MPSKRKPETKRPIPRELRTAAAAVKAGGHKLRGLTDAVVRALASHGLLDLQKLDLDDLQRVGTLLNQPPTEAQLRERYDRLTGSQFVQLCVNNVKGKPS